MDKITLDEWKEILVAISEESVLQKTDAELQEIIDTNYAFVSSSIGYNNIINATK